MVSLKKPLKRTISFLSAAAVMTSALAFVYRDLPENTVHAALETGQVANPIIYSDVPDPDIIRVGDTYYMVSTTMFYNPGVPIMKSKDMASWEICNYVYDTYHDGDNQNLKNGKHDYAHGQWATSLRYHKGTYYVFFGSYGSGKSYIYKTNDIENGKWTRSEINGMYHDASMLFDDDGRNYLVYGGGGDIKIKELNSDMTGFANGAQERTLFKTGLTGLSGEGSHIQKINGWYYVFIIAWPNGSGRIELCYRSKSLTGNFEGKTILNSGVGTYGAGAAQGGIVDTPDGKWYGLVFQDHGGIGRIPALVPVTWQNDWPIMGVNGKVPVVMDLPGDHTGTQLAKSDDFSYSSNNLKLEWQWNHNPDNKNWSVTDRPGWLRLTNGTVAKSIVHAKNTLTMRTEGPSCQGVIKMDVSHMKPGDYAGLSAFQYNYGNVGVRVTDNGEKKIYMATNAGYNGNADVLGSYDKIQEEVSLSGDTVWVKTDFKFANVDSSYNISNNIDTVNFYYSLDGSNWKKIGSEVKMGFDLKFFTGYRNAIYSYGTKSTGGYVDIDEFDYTRAEWNPAQAVIPLEPDANGYWFHDTFENGEGTWSGRGAAKVGPSGRAPYEGKEALVISERDATWNGAQKALSTSIFKPGEEYAFSACFNSFEGGDTVEYKLTLQYEAGGETKYDKIAQTFGNQGEYVQLYNPNYKIPEGATSLYLIAETTEDTCNFYIDEVIGAVAGTKIDGPVSNVVPATKIKGDLDMDSRISVADLVLLKNGILNGFKNNSEKSNADVDSSSSTDAADALYLQEYLVGKISAFPDNTPPEPEKKPMRTISEYTPEVAKNVANNEPDSAKQEKAGVTYGKIESKSYYSAFCKREKKYNVLLPANYSKDKKYPVLYVMHGYWENQDRMIIKGNGTMYTKQIIGNAIAEGAAEDMIVVFPYIYSSQTQNDCSAMDDKNNIAYDNFDTVLTTELMPLIEKEYSVATGRENTAITGFSMGGRESLNIGMKHPDLFGYVGAICPAPGASGAWKFASEEAAPSLIFITAGGNDTVVYTTPNGYHDNFTKNSVPHIWHYYQAGYHGDNSIHAHLYNFVRAIFRA